MALVSFLKLLKLGAPCSVKHARGVPAFHVNLQAIYFYDLVRFSMMEY